MAAAGLIFIAPFCIVTAVSAVCQTKSSGDANCDGVVQMTDFEIWRKEYMKSLTTLDSDFDGNGVVNMLDFEAWRKGYFVPTATQTPTVTPTSPTNTPTPRPTVTVSPTQPATTLDQQISNTWSLAASRATADVAAFSTSKYPSSTSSTSWSLTSASSWTSGFFPGVLWFLYQHTNDPAWKTHAADWQKGIEGQKTNTGTHDVGFMLFSSYGNGFKITQDASYKQVLLTTAASLASRYNATVGCIRSWNSTDPDFQVIIDNMMNIEILFWGAKNGGQAAWNDMATSHALKTAQNHVRADGSTYHIVHYNSTTGAVVSQGTVQGYSDSSTWSRGQAWAIYGFTTSYRETQNQVFLDTARKTADYYIAHLPSDFVPFWDFQAPEVSPPRDSSSAAIAASGLLELSQLDTDPARQTKYFEAAKNILTSLTSAKYLSSGTSTPSILLHGTQNKPKGNYDTGLIFGDYYLLEALLRYEQYGKR